MAQAAPVLLVIIGVWYYRFSVRVEELDGDIKTCKINAYQKTRDDNPHNINDGIIGCSLAKGYTAITWPLRDNDGFTCRDGRVYFKCKDGWDNPKESYASFTCWHLKSGWFF
jgi:hypothetical protein